MTAISYLRKPLQRIVPQSIALNGIAASGTSSTAAALLKLFPRCEIISGGGLMRAIADSNGYKDRIGAFLKAIPDNPQWGNVDDMVDKQILKESLQPCRIFDLRMNALCEYSYQVLLVCPYSVCVERRKDDLEYVGKTPYEIMQSLFERNWGDGERLHKKYPGCVWPWCMYDLVIDTSKVIGADNVAAQIRDGYHAWIEKNKKLIDYSVWSNKKCA